MPAIRSDGNGGVVMSMRWLSTIGVLISILSAVIGASMAAATTNTNVEHNTRDIQSLELALETIQAQAVSNSISLARIEQKVDDVKDKIQ